MRNIAMTAALIIAAGKTPSKDAFFPLKEVGGLTAIERQIHSFQLAGVERVVVVLGEDNPALERQIARMGVILLANSGGPDAEMLSSVQLGLQCLSGKCSKVLVTPVDVPLFSANTVQLLLCDTHKVAAPSYGGRAGHPLALSAQLFPTVLAYTGHGGLAGAVRESGQAVHFIDVPDEGILWDVQKQAEPGPLLQNHSLHALRPELKLYLARERVFFGPGPYLLLSLIAETGSLRLACQQMGISYSKGWNMIASMEKQTGIPIVTKKRGGREKGCSTITEDGRRLLRAYASFLRESKQEMQKLFEKHFGDFDTKTALDNKGE